MALANIKMFAPAGVTGTVNLPDGTSASIASDGTISVSPLFRNTLEAAGWVIAISQSLRFSSAGTTMAAASAAAMVASVTMTNGGMTVAAQPVPMRPVQWVIGGNTAAMSGILTVAYVANDGSSQVDALSLSLGAGSAGIAGATLQMTKCVATLTSATVTGLTASIGSPFAYAGTTAAFGVPVPLGASITALTAMKEMDQAGFQSTSTDQGTNIGTFSSVTLGAFTPHTAPATSVQYDLYYSCLTPG
jgi:hypothetical protein